MQKKFQVSVFLILIVYICAFPVVPSPASDTIDNVPPATADLGIQVTDGLVSIDVKDAGIRPVLHEIARKAKLDLNISDDIDGSVTISAKALPLEDILKRLCENRAIVYQYIPEKNICRIISVGAYSKGKSERDTAPLTDKSLLGDTLQGQESGHSTKRLEPDRGERLYDSRGRLLYKPGELLVRFKKGTTEKQIADLHTSMESAVTGGITRIGLQRVKLRKGFPERDAITAYMTSGLVEIAERHALRYADATIPNDDYFGIQWGLAKIRAPEAWDITTGDPDIIIAVIDTGVDYSHPDLEDNIWVNMAEMEGVVGEDDDDNGYIDDVYGWDFADDNNDPTPLPLSYGNHQQDHGTHVAGIIAAEGNNAMGIAGVCWNAKIMVLKVQKDGILYMESLAIIKAMDYAIAKGARIVNCSFGGGGYTVAEDEAFAVLEGADIIAVCAAGNDGTDNDETPEYPASYDLDNIIAVAASDQGDDLAGLSNYGLESVDVMAPGIGIKSTIPATPYTDASVEIAPDSYTAYGMAFAGTTDEAGITGTLYNCRKGYPGDFPTEVSGYIALIERGKTDESSPDFYFWEKVYNALEAGAVAVIVYNNVSNDPFDGWTLGTSGDWPPVVCISQESGLALGEMDTSQATVINQLGDTPTFFGNMSGTSMAAPHVSGIAGLILSKNPGLDYVRVKSVIMDTVDEIPTVSDKLVFGGRVNAMSALFSVCVPGDVSGDNEVQLDDAILCLQVLAGLNPEGVYFCADVNGDGAIGLSEAMYALQRTADLRNQSPVLAPIGDKTVGEGEVLSFQVTGTDPDDDDLTFTATTLPGEAVFDSGTGAFSWTPTYSESGTYEVTFTVADDRGHSDSETITITVIDKTPLFNATQYFPLHVGDWWDYNNNGTVGRTQVSGTKTISDDATMIMSYADGTKDYYTSDLGGVKLYGEYVTIEDYYTGDIIFETPLLLMPDNANMGTDYSSTSRFVVPGYGVLADITSTTSIIGVEAVATENTTLIDCIKVSVQLTSLTAQIDETTYYWFYKGVGCVKQISGSDTYIITESNVNGVGRTY